MALSKKLINKAIKRIQAEGSPFTPDAYREAFCKEAKLAGVAVQDCMGVEKFIPTLSKDLQKQIKEYRLKTTDELVRFLITQLNQTKSQYSEKKVKKLAHLFANALTPSIASKEHQVLQKTMTKLTTNPTVLMGTEQIENEIKSAISLRISLDKESLKEIIRPLDGVMQEVTLRLLKMIETSNTSNSDIKEIKQELKKYQHSDNDLKKIHDKIYTLVDSFEKGTQVLSQELTTYSNELKEMDKKIKRLEKELEEAKKDSREDFLTKLYNKRALEEFFEKKEAEYKRHNTNYSMVMFDLDHFKNINDTYGHDTGDIVLRSFAKILQSQIRKEDILGRFGGEEFVALLGQTDINGAKAFAEKVRKNVEQKRFMHKKERMPITVSCGVSERKQCNSMEELFALADENLYKAKNGGRNRVVG